ncbi:hypothetical protein EHM69_08145 [candidate division KSB1 bacterium]|nr:MAG: hypothetical protein EHM69_08145 [candidate division KSB1 bacterium]
MLRKNLLLLSLVFALPFAALSATFDGLPQAVQAAHHAISTPEDSANCPTIVSELLRLTDKYPASSLVPEALWLAAQLQKQSGHPSAALSLARKIVEQHPSSTVAPEAFEVVWNDFRTNKFTDTNAAEFAAAFANKLAPNSAAAKYYQLAFNIHLQANRWQDAVHVGNLFIKKCPDSVPDAPFLLSLSEAALKSADMAAAQRTLENFIDRYPHLPQLVSARAALGKVYISQGNETAANENYSLAWSAFQKHSNESAYRQAGITSAAAEALWFLQKNPHRQYAQLTSVNLPLNEKTARRQAESLEQAYTQIMLTDHGYAPACFNAIGDLHRQMADALLAEGYRKCAVDFSAENPPYESALPEYSRAIAAYSQAYDRAAQPHSHESGLAIEHPDWHTASVYAADQAFALTLGQGDAVYAWAMQLQQNAPKTEPGANGNQVRFDYLASCVAPLVSQGMEYSTQALNFANSKPLAKKAEKVRQNLDIPLRPFASEVAMLCRNQNRDAAGLSTQLSKTFSFGFQASSTTSLAESVEDNFHSASLITSKSEELLSNLYAGIAQWRLSEPVQSYWDSIAVSPFYEYASLCQTMQADLTVCLAAFTPAKNDEDAQRFRNRLSKLQTKGASEEYTGLVRWHDLADRYKMKTATGDKLAARLAELDPAYSTDRLDDFPSASRRKP